MLPVGSIFGESTVDDMREEFEWRAPGGPFCSYRTCRVTRHTLRREITFPRTACALSALLRTANFTALQYCNTLHQSPAPAQPRSWWPSTTDMRAPEEEKRMKEWLESLTLHVPHDSKSSIPAINDLWTARMIITLLLHTHHWCKQRHMVAEKNVFLWLSD